jgi:hypothetical protein
MKERQARGDWLNQVRAGYQEDPMFAEPECPNELRCSEDGLWWHEDALVIHDVCTLRQDIMHEGLCIAAILALAKLSIACSVSFDGPACGLMCWPMSGHVQRVNGTRQATSHQLDCYSRCPFLQGGGSVSHWV